MPQIYTLAEAQDALRPYYNNAQTKYTLDVMRELMEYLGNPQNKLTVLHVAGTSGKTSTAYYAAALLKESGKRVGLSVSPHVDTVNERVQVNGQPLREADFCRSLSEFIELVDKSGIRPSYFELLVGLAYWEFARQGLDYAVIEVGLGGLLDGTNVIDSENKLCLITDIGLDHTQILGDTLAAITGQKAGIIKPGNTVFMYRQSDEVTDVVATVAAEQHAAVHWLDGSSELSQYEFLPPFQQRNLGLAAAAVDAALRRDTGHQLAQDARERAAHIVVPARLETRTIGDKTVIIDGSHNQQKLTSLMQGVEKLHPNQDIAVLCAFVAGPDSRWQDGLLALMPHVQHILFTSFHSESDLPKKSIDPELLATFAGTQSEAPTMEVVTDPAEALQRLLNRPEPLLLVTGSFYLLNHVRPRIKEQI
jgi:dihydrofolate synthase / folylpolyglutamate synthase